MRFPLTNERDQPPRPSAQSLEVSKERRGRICFGSVRKSRTWDMAGIGSFNEVTNSIGVSPYARIGLQGSVPVLQQKLPPMAVGQSTSREESNQSRPMCIIRGRYFVFFFKAETKADWNNTRFLRFSSPYRQMRLQGCYHLQISVYVHPFRSARLQPGSDGLETSSRLWRIREKNR